MGNAILGCHHESDDIPFCLEQKMGYNVRISAFKLNSKGNEKIKRRKYF